MKSILLFLTSLTFISRVLSQETFEVILGGDNSNQWGYDVVESYDQGFVIVGQLNDNILLMKINSKGNVITNQNIGKANEINYANSICKSRNFNYAICGMTKGYPKSRQEDAFYVQIDDNMNNNRSLKNFGSESSEVAKKIIELNDAGFLISIDKKTLDGFNENGELKNRNDCFIIKVTSDGNQSWIVDFTDMGETWSGDILQSSDKNIYIVGTVKNKLENDGDVFICKMKSTGELIWKKTIKPKINYNEFSKSIIEDKTGNLIIAGIRTSPKRDPFLMKITKDGVKLTEEYYDVGYDAGGNDIIQTDKGELILVGSDFGHKGFLLHLDASAKIIEKYLFEPSISKILMVKGEYNFVLLGETLKNKRFRSIFLKKTNLNELKEGKKLQDADIEERSKKLFYDELPAIDLLHELLDETCINYAIENVNQEFQGNIKVTLRGKISVIVDANGKAIESRVIPDTIIKNKQINIIEKLNHSKLLDHPYKPATWKGYNIKVQYDRTLSESYIISQYNIMINKDEITKIKFSDDKYFLADLSLRRELLTSIPKDKKFQVYGKYKILFITKSSFEYGYPIILNLSKL